MRNTKNKEEGKVNSTRMPRQQEHQDLKKKNSCIERQRGKIKMSVVRKEESMEVVIRRKTAVVDSKTEGEMKNVPRGARVLTNTEKKFYKQQ